MHKLLLFLFSLLEFLRYVLKLYMSERQTSIEERYSTPSTVHEATQRIFALTNAYKVCQELAHEESFFALKKLLSVAAEELRLGIIMWEGYRVHIKDGTWKPGKDFTTWEKRYIDLLCLAPRLKDAFSWFTEEDKQTLIQSCRTTFAEWSDIEVFIESKRMREITEIKDSIEEKVTSML